MHRDAAGLGDSVHGGIAINNRAVVDHVEIMPSFVKGESSVIPELVVHRHRRSPHIGAIDDGRGDHSPPFGGSSFDHEIIGVTGNRDRSHRAAGSRRATHPQDVVVRAR